MAGSRILVHVIRNLINCPASYGSRASMLINGVRLGKQVVISGNIHVNNAGQIRIGDFCKLSSGRIANPVGGALCLSFVTTKTGVINVGERSGISNCELYSASKLRIGERVLIGGGTRIWDTDFHPINSKARRENASPLTAPITIEDDVFIGGYSTILKGVTIGKRSIVAACSVVTRSIPEGEVWAGNPARFVKRTE